MSAIHEGWTSERVELLKNYFNAGLSCSQIACEIGATRNAVIGKLHRMGLGRPKYLLADQLERTRDAKNASRPKGFAPEELALERPTPSTRCSWRPTLRHQAKRCLSTARTNAHCSS